MTTPLWYAGAAFAGKWDFGVGLNVLAIASFPHDDRLAFAVREETGLRSLRDLRERQYPLRVAIPASRQLHPAGVVAEEVLAQYGVTLRDIEAWGGQVVDPNDTKRCLLGEDKAQAALEWVRKLMWDDKAMAQRLLLAPMGQGFNTQALFASGKFAMVEDGFYPFSMARNIQKQINWRYMHTPTGPARRRVLGTTDGFVIWKGTKYPDAAWELLKYLAGPDYQQNQVRSTGLLPVRYSVLDQWKKICVERFPELADVNLDVGPEAMKMGYPGNRILFKKDAEARQTIVAALEKVFIVGGTPVSYFKDVAKQVTDQMRS
uniref:sn-glycerol-3-phosphate-binding periplasmic protein UgpB n=1 Tax=Thermorudis sp. TaxID=1969470 RepID=A0A7C3AMR4_9BACT